jgi:spore coat protein U-like protein
MGFTAMQLRSLPFGTIGTNTLAGTGTGLAQSVTDCAAATPSPGTYNDTIVVTLTY